MSSTFALALDGVRPTDILISIETSPLPCGAEVLDQTLRALSDPTRREILRLLRQGDLPAGEIAARFSTSAATVSHHLATLREAGLVTAERNGRSIVYSLEATVFQELVGELMNLFGTGEEP